MWSPGWILLAVVWVCVAGQRQKPPEIKEPAQANTIYVPERNNGKDFELQCYAEGNPTPTYKWTKDNQEVTQGVNTDTGLLTIQDYNYREHDGDYMCIATNEFETGLNSPPTKAASFSPVITLKQIRVTINADTETKIKTGTQFTYFRLPCEVNGVVVVDDANYNWYKAASGVESAQNQLNLGEYKDRVYIDNEGSLHFIYLTLEDQLDSSTFYQCGVASFKASGIKMTGQITLKVDPITGGGTGQAPQIQYKTENKKFLRFSDAELECVFSGYDPDVNGQNPPSIEWMDKERRTITRDSDKFTISADRRKLTIRNINEEDEGEYFCMAKNSVDSTEPIPVMLDIHAKPIFVANGAPQDITKPEGKDAEFRCDAESMKDETPAKSPEWFINGQKWGTHMDSNKYSLSADKKSLTIMNVNKPRDIACVQCMVKNDVGETRGDGCLTIVLAIDVKYQPQPRQEVVLGDIIDLTVLADWETGDGIEKLSKTWSFGNQTGDLDLTLPPFAEYVDANKRVIINTTNLSEEEYLSVSGRYSFVIKNSYQEEVISTYVDRVDVAPTTPAAITASAGFPMWIIGVIVGILLLILIVLCIVCVICRKREEGDYNVDKKEVGAGLDPKKELMEKGFDDYSRPNMSDYEDIPRQPLPYDEDVPLNGDDNKSLGEYSEDDDARLGFNEDGSFIGQYYKKDPRGPAAPNYENTDSNV